ncbi:MAG: hypothetical protein D6814_06825, partial [Calditrichaeota bacterium]
DMVLLFSEGLVRLKNARGEKNSLTWFINFVKTYGNMQPSPFLARLKSAIEKFMQGEPFQQDVTVIAIKNMQSPAVASSDQNAREIETRFLSIEEEIRLLRATKKHPELQPQDLAHALGEPFARFDPERIQYYLGRRDRTRKNGSIKAPNRSKSTQALKRHFQREMLEKFPIRQLLYRKYEFKGNTEAIQKALAHYQNGRFQESLIEFTKARRVIADSDAVYCFFGNLYLLLNMTIKARQEYLKALKINPRCVHAYLSLAYIALLHQDYEATIGYLTTAIRLGEDIQQYERFLHQLVSALEKQNGHPEWLS